VFKTSGNWGYLIKRPSGWQGDNESVSVANVVYGQVICKDDFEQLSEKDVNKMPVLGDCLGTHIERMGKNPSNPQLG